MDQTLKLQSPKQIVLEKRAVSKKINKQQHNYMKETASSLNKKYNSYSMNNTTNKPLLRKNSFNTNNTCYLKNQTNISFSKKKSFTLNNEYGYLDPYGHFNDCILINDPYDHFK
jgi:hypothetical protein